MSNFLSVKSAGGTSLSGSSSSFHKLDNQKRGDLSFDVKIKSLEISASKLVEESCVARDNQNMQVAVDKAKEAATIEKHILRLREQAGLGDSLNAEVHLSVLLNLALQYQSSGNLNEAISVYQEVIRL